MSKGGSDFHNLSASQVIEEKFSELSLFSVSNGDLGTAQRNPADI